MYTRCAGFFECSDMKKKKLIFLLDCKRISQCTHNIYEKLDLAVPHSTHRIFLPKQKNLIISCIFLLLLFLSRKEREVHRTFDENVHTLVPSHSPFCTCAFFLPPYKYFPFFSFSLLSAKRKRKHNFSFPFKFVCT